MHFEWSDKDSMNSQKAEKFPFVFVLYLTKPLFLKKKERKKKETKAVT